MFKFFNNLFKKSHVCWFGKPIISEYVSFHQRDIVYECKCGKRKLFRVYRDFDQPFPIETTIGSISTKEMNEILKKKR